MNNPVIKTCAFVMEKLKRFAFVSSSEIPSNNSIFINFSEKKDMSEIGWYNGDKTILYVAPIHGDKILANISL